MANLRLAYLFRQLITGAATEEEKAEWLTMANNPEHESSIRQLIDQYLQEEKNEEVVSAKTTTTLLNKIFSSGNDVLPVEITAPVVRRTSGAWWKAAAAAAILIGLFSGILYIRERKATIPVQHMVSRDRMKNDAAPGRDKAILTLADGTTVPLDSAGHQVLHQAGVLVKQQDGQLAYQGNTTEGVFYNTLTTPKGCQYRLVLPDGTKVWLNAASSIRYPIAFTGNERSVELTGEGYFEVSQNRSKPFQVKVGETKVNVLGTHFNVMAYANEDAVRTTLLEGAVNISTAAGIRLIKPGQQAVVKNGSGAIDVVTADTEAAIAWKEGYFLFQQSDLPVLLRQFERWYDIDVDYKGQKKTYEFVGRIPRTAHLSSVLRLLEVNNIPYEYDNRRLIINP